jgi:peroxiredoxin
MSETEPGRRVTAGLNTLTTKQAPEATLLEPDGHPVKISTTWRDRPAVLVFLRYFGCPFCQLQVGRMIEDQPKFEEANGRVVLIGHQQQDASKLGGAFKPFTYLFDADRSAYKAYGLERGSLMQVAGPRVA